jgi:hypothetical protein
MRKIKSKLRSHWTIHIWLIVTLLFVGCNGDKNKLEGYWIVDELKIKGYNQPIPMYTNMVSFETDGSCTTPEINWLENRQATWEFTSLNRNHFLVIHSHNFFNRKYTYTFYDDPARQVHKIRLTSDSIDMDCAESAKY